MTAGLGQRLSVALRQPFPSAPLPSGRRVTFVADITLGAVWFPEPKYGAKISSVDGQPRSALVCFESRVADEVRAPFSGKLSVDDTGLDVHTPLGFRDAGAGLGVSATLRSDEGLEMRFGHFERGSTHRLTTINAGEVIGRTGNTGRCVDGCGRRFVSYEFSARSGQRLTEFSKPLKVHVSLDGERITRMAIELAPGQRVQKGIKLGAGTPKKAPGKKTVALTVELYQATGARPIATETIDLKVML